MHKKHHKKVKPLHLTHIAKMKPIHVAKMKPIHIKPIHFKKTKPFHLGKEIKNFGKDLGIGNAFKGLEDIAKGFSPAGIGKELSGAIKGLGGGVGGISHMGENFLMGAGVVGGIILVVLVGGYAFKGNGGSGRVK